MPQIRPFVGLLYEPGVVGDMHRVSAPPYDTISVPDRDRYHGLSPHNVIRLILGKDEPGDNGSSNKYIRAAEHLRAWREEGALAPTARSAVYPYEMRFHYGGRGRTIRGVIGEVSLEPWGGSILGHERTMPGPVEDRLRLLRAVHANLSPIYGVLRGPSERLTGFLDRVTATEPVREVADEAGTHHRMWAVSEQPDGSPPVFDAEDLMIADGHHRYTVALAYQQEMRARSGPGPWDAVMMLVVDGASESPPVLPIHRLVLGGPVPPLPEPERVRDMAEVLASLSDDPAVIGVVRMEDGEAVHEVARIGGGSPAVCALHRELLDAVDPATLRFVADAVAAEEAVLAGKAAAAYLLPPTEVDRVRSVVAGGERLPQKSTYFWPKPRTGMVIRPLDLR
jgi:uncharacterized protein (DUF1015 family)